MGDITQLKKIYFDKFTSCKSNFKNCSFDDANNFYLVNSIKECINYDLVKNKIFFGRDSVCSVDSLGFDEVNNKLLFIEFKDTSYKSCKGNSVQSGRESFLINRLVVSLLGDENMNSISKKFILVLGKSKNSVALASYYAAKQSNSLIENHMYKHLNDTLINYDYFDNKLFDEIEIVSEDYFDDVVKNI